MEMVNNILIEVLGSIAEQERNTIRKRQRGGIEDAQKKETLKFGRPQSQKPENWTQVYKRWKSGEITAVKAMELIQLTKTTFYKLAKTEYPK